MDDIMVDSCDASSRQNGPDKVAAAEDEVEIIYLNLFGRGSST